jgi:hypothetical protein
MPHETSIHVTVDKGLRDALLDVAQKTERSASACIRLALRQWLEKQRLPAQTQQEPTAA